MSSTGPDGLTIHAMEHGHVIIHYRAGSVG